MPPLPQAPTTIFQPLLEEHCNALGQVRAGYLLKLIDVIGAYCGLKYIQNRYTLVTASLDRTNFVANIRLWEFIAMEARVTQVWSSSMEVAVEVYAVSMRPETNMAGFAIDDNGMQRRYVATAYLVFVAFDRDRNKPTLPPLPQGTTTTEAIRQAANIRKQQRLADAKTAPLLPLIADGDESDASYWQEESLKATERHANINGNVFGGVILEQMTQTARHCAEKHCLGATVVGARIDRMSFLAPGYIGETIRTRAMVTATFATSMELQVEVHAVNPNTPDTPRLIATCYMVYVRLTPHGHPADVLPWQPITPPQQQRAGDAQQRRSQRQAESHQLEPLPPHPPASRQPLCQRLTNAWQALTS